MMTTARRQWWVVCAAVLVGLAAGAVSLAASRPVFASTASVLVQTIGSAPVNLPTEAELVRSSQTAADAASILHRPDDEIAAATTVRPLPDSSVLLITFEAGTPRDAQVGARAVATAYLANRAQAANAAINDQVGVLTGRIAASNADVARLNAQAAKLPPNSVELANARAVLATLGSQVAGLTTRLNDLETTTVNPGQVIGDPPTPDRPVSPRPWLLLTGGALAGLLAGLVTAVGRHRFSRRVRHSADVERRTGVPVLARLPEQERVELLRDAGLRSFNRLRNEVMATLGNDDRVILVTGVGPSSASTLVAANLATALARADTEVVLIGANAPEPGAVALSQVFDVGDIPGLTDVLTGRISLSRALQKAARLPRLRVITPGGTASAAGLLHSEGARNTIHALRRQARYVVIEAPSTASGAEAQSLARVADAAILVVETGRSRHAQVSDAAQQLRVVGTRILGAVVLGPVLSSSDMDHPRASRHSRPVDRDSWLEETTAVLDSPTARLRPVPHPTPAPAPTQG
jgi:Mrp family chromosome partitioning ATPase